MIDLKNITSKKGFGKILSIMQNSAKGNLALSENKMLENAQKVLNAVGGTAGRQVAASNVKKYILDTLFIIPGSVGVKLKNQIDDFLKNDLDNQKITALQNWIISNSDGKLTKKEYTDEEKEKLKQMVEEEAKKNKDALDRIKSGKATAEDVSTINNMLVDIGVKKEDLKNNKLKLGKSEILELKKLQGGDELFKGNDPDFIFIIEEIPDSTQKIK